MKLLNILAITAIGTLFAVGCSSTTSITSDGGTDSATGDTGKTDTGKADTGTTTETGTDAGDPEAICRACIEAKCATELAACNASDATKKGCADLINCLVACGANADCQNKCITDSTSTEGKNFVQCVYVDKCNAECTSSGG